MGSSTEQLGHRLHLLDVLRYYLDDHVTMGKLNGLPRMPHSQPQNSSATKIASDFILAILPDTHVVTNVPTSVAIPRDAPATNSAIGTESNCMNATIPAAPAVTPGRGTR